VKNPNYGDLKLMFQYSYLDRKPWYVATGTPASAHLGMFFLRHPLRSSLMVTFPNSNLRFRLHPTPIMKNLSSRPLLGVAALSGASAQPLINGAGSTFVLPDTLKVVGQL